MSIVEWLDTSSFDELVEIEIPNNRCTNLYHVKGKYHVPVYDASFDEMHAYALENMVHPEDREIFRSLLDPSTLFRRLEESEMPGVLDAQFRYKLQSGEWRWVEEVVIGGAEFGLPEGTVHCYIFDIQNQKDRELGNGISRHYDTETLRDDKTRLLWEKPFVNAAKNLIDKVDRSQWCFIAIDLEHFRLLNDWHGRDAGDFLLARIGEVLARVERDTGGVAGYFGQDDFSIVMPFDESAIEALNVEITDLIEDLTQAVGFRPLFGVCRTDAASALLDVFDCARIALEGARMNLKRGICVFDPAMADRSSLEYQVLLDFKEGLRNREFEVFLQPQCNVASGKVVGVEALARWRKPDGSLVPPIDFIPVLEKHGFITDLDLYIWEEVCAGMRAWIDEGREAVPVSVNVSQVDLFSIDVVGTLAGLVEKYGISPELLKVEITESAFAESSAAVAEMVDQLHEKGFTVLMDDFGSGYSSLNILSSLNVDVIKLDAAFLRMDDEGKRKSMRIVESIINMTMTMSIPIISEGVETKEQVDFLESLGCSYIQGYYYYRPMPKEDFESIIRGGDLIDGGGIICKANEQLRLKEFLDENVYSDAMLNCVLGPVAIYLLHDDGRVDITRFNEQFYSAVGVPGFSERLDDIGQFVPEEEREAFADLFDRAMKDDLNGATDTVSFARPDGSYARFLLHCYYLGDNGEGKRFYASAKDVTEIYESKRQMKILSDHLSSSIVFATQGPESWRFQVVIHGMAETVGLSAERFQRELNDGTFYARLDAEEAARLKAAVGERVEQGADFAFPFTIDDAQGEPVRLRMQADHARHLQSDITYILGFNKISKPSGMEK